MDGSGAISRHLIQSVVVSHHPDSVVRSLGYSKHGIIADRVLRDGMLSHILKGRLIHGFHHHTLPIDAHPHIAIGIADGILHVAGCQVEIIHLDGAECHLPCLLIIDAQSSTIGADEEPSVCPCIKAKHCPSHVSACCHLGKTVIFLIVSIQAIVDGDGIEFARLALTNLPRILHFGISLQTFLRLSVHLICRIHKPQSILRRLKKLYRIGISLSCQEGRRASDDHRAILCHFQFAMSRGCQTHHETILLDTCHTNDTCIDMIAILIKDGDVGKLVRGIVIHLHTHVGAHQQVVTVILHHSRAFIVEE